MKTWNETINTIILETIDKSWRLKTKFSAADVEKIQTDTVSEINNAVKEIVRQSKPIAKTNDGLPIAPGIAWNQSIERFEKNIKSHIDGSK